MVSHGGVCVYLLSPTHPFNPHPPAYAVGYQGVYLLGRGATKLLYVAGNMTDDPGTIAKALANTPAYTVVCVFVQAS